MMAPAASHLVHTAPYLPGERSKKISHATRVVHALRKAGYPDQVQTVGWLHDILESTHLSAKDLARRFPPEVVDAVTALTQTPAMGRKTYRKQIRANPLAMIVKWFDINDHMTRLHLLPPDQAAADRKKYRKDLRKLYKIGAQP